MKNKKGITLIALIITIIVMLILAIVSIKVASDSGLFGKAQIGTSKTSIEAAREQAADIVMQYYDIEDQKINTEKTIGGQNFLQKIKTIQGLNDNNAISGNVIDGWTVEMKNGRTFRIEANGTVGQAYESTQQTTPWIPNDIGEGETVLFSYDGTEANKKEWTVLYKYEDSVEIISPEIMGRLTLGYDDPTAQNPGDVDNDGTANTNIDKSIYSYNNAITTINNYCESLITNTDPNIVSVRSVGSNPNNPSSENSAMYLSNILENWNSIYNNIGKLEDNNYQQDYNKIIQLNVPRPTGANICFIPSRKGPDYIHDSDNGEYFYEFSTRYFWSDRTTWIWRNMGN